MSYLSRKILLIEDSAEHVAVIRQMMTALKEYTLVTADSLSSGLKILRDEAIDLVLLDLILPDSSGVDTFQRVQDQAPSLPVVVLTVLADEKLALQAISLGCQDYLVKGRIDANLLARSVRYAIERKQAQEALRESELRFSAFMLEMPAAAWIKDLQGRYIYANAEAERIFSTPLSALYGKTDFELFSERTARQFVENDQRVLAQGGTFETTEVLRQADGIDHVSIVRKFSVPGPDGRPAHIAGVAFDITDRKRAEEELREGEAKLYGIATTAHDAVILLDNDGKVSFWNPAATKMFGYTTEEMLGEFLHSFIMPERHMDSFKKGFEKFRTTGKGPLIGKVYEILATRKDGSEFPVELSLAALKLKDRWNAIGIARDITERRRMEEALELSQFSIDHASVCVFFIGPDARFLYVNEQTCRTLGYAREELLSLAMYDIDADHPLSGWSERWAQLKRERSLHFETRHRRKDGTFIPVEMFLNYMSFAGREYNVAFGQDITERRRAEQRLRAREAQLSLIFDCVYDVIFVVAAEPQDNFRFISVNRRFLDATGLREDQVAGRLVNEVIPEPSRSLVLEKYRSAVRSGQSVQWEEVTVYPSGKKIGEVRVAPIFDERGVCTQLIGTVHDVTERKLAEEALRLSESRFRNLFQQSSLSMQLLAPDGRTVEVNHAWEELWGVKSGAAKDYNILQDKQLIKKGIMPYILRGFAGEAAEIPSILYDPAETVPGSKPRWVKAFIYPVKARDGSVHELVLMHLDVTDTVKATGALRASEEALRQAYAGLEIKVRERTRELARTNEELNVEITERRRAVELIKRSHELSDTLNDLNAVIHSTLDFEEIMQRVVKEAALAIRVDGSAIGLMHDRTFEIRYVHDRAAHLAGWTVPLDQLTGVSATATSGEPIAFSDAAHDVRLNLELVRKWGFQSMLVSPLIIRKRMAGALVFYSFSRPFVFQREHVDFSRKLAASVSLALENAMLYRELRESRTVSEARLAELRTIYETAPVGLCFVDRSMRYVSINRRLAEINSIPAEETIGRSISEIVSDEDAARTIEALCKQTIETGIPIENVEIAMRKELIVSANYYPVMDQAGTVVGINVVVQDVTERKRMEEEITHLAHHDVLTGLPNRRLFKDITNLEIAQARRNRKKLAILFLDLDRFKEINDTLGHEAGDELLKQAATLFRETVRESDTVARIGGDEFNVILSDIARPEDVSEIAQKIIKRFRSPFSIAGNELNVTTSIGISVYPDDGTEIDTLLRYADIAMYHAKESGRNTFRFYNPAINVRSVERMLLETMLRKSIAMEELVIYYQPQIDIQTKHMVCAEALIRWHHPERGLLTPDHFLAQAEETGFITEIDEWALKAVCGQVRSWVESGFPPVRVTVNLSASQFEKPDLVARIASILEETRMEPDWLDLEVTESTAMSNVARTAFLLRQLREMGVHVSIDDFGTGYSSLNYLKKLPIERLKIDRSFILDIARDPDDRAIISAVTSMARKMGIRTVAEGVETEEQLSFLRSVECDEAQGFLFSRPVGSQEFSALIAPR